MDDRRADPAMTHSNFDRRPRDQYWTEPWVTRALLRVFGPQMLTMQARGGVLWEPAAGRGDMVGEMIGYGLRVHASDVDPSNWNSELGHVEPRDFLDVDSLLDPPDKTVAIVTNPPYDKAREFIERALQHDVSLVAMILRSEWNHSSKRCHLFERDDFVAEIVLTARPRWDNWLEIPKPKHGPRHNYSLFVWSPDGHREWLNGHDVSTQYWEGRT